MFVIVMLGGAAVVACVALHFEVLRHLSLFLDASTVRLWLRFGVTVVGAIAAHVLEVLLFAGLYLAVAPVASLGRITGDLENHFTDFTYFSFVTFTTVGYGDVTPDGPIRILAGVEALTGLILVAWSASFLFVQMERHWKGR